MENKPLNVPLEESFLYTH